MKPHKHAAIIKAYAERAQVSETPWDIIQFRWANSQEWQSPTEPLRFGELVEYRIKPRIININGFEVPEPMRSEPGHHELYFHPNIDAPSRVKSDVWYGVEHEEFLLASGVIHMTREAAELHARALLSFTAVTK